MSDNRRWIPGETIVLQEVWGGKLWGARPMKVVRDDEEVLALWFPKNTVFKVPVTPQTREYAPTRRERLIACLHLQDWILADRSWDVSSLWLIERGAYHATAVTWWDDGSHRGYYVNFQEPYRRTSRGIQTFDLALDMLVDDDLATWEWKDEDEFEAYELERVIDAFTVEAVRREGDRVIERIKSKRSPFCDPWPDWTPPTSWELPTLPEDWDRLEGDY
jgi:predicted RNA-binding protein associated with RNAse of E/G family